MEFDKLFSDYGMQGFILAGAIYASRWLATNVAKPITEAVVQLLKVMVSGEIEDAQVKVKIQSDLHAIRECAEELRVRQEHHIKICESETNHAMATK